MSTTPPEVTTLVMAGSRKGPDNPVAQLQNKSHKCMVEIDGVVMLERVVEELINSGKNGRIFVSIESEELMREAPRLAEFLDSGAIQYIQALGNLSDSVISAVNAIDNALPLVITTGDNALHTADLNADFVDQFLAASGDVAIGWADASVVLADFPDVGLAFHWLKDGGYSSTNLYGLRTEQALSAVKVFEGGGQFGKRHMRILKAFGVMPFVVYKLKLATLDQLMTRIGRNLIVSMDAILLNYSSGPIDVDSEHLFNISEKELVARRQAAEG
jgi:GTP:adenosylcobinamide-phosphate guanylyltransferase